MISSIPVLLILIAAVVGTFYGIELYKKTQILNYSIFYNNFKKKKLYIIFLKKRINK